jgi:hypothetical protein
LVSKASKSGHELGSTAMVFRTIVGIDEQASYLWKASLNRGPKLFNAVNNEIAGHTGCGHIEIEFPLLWQVDAEGGYFLLWFEVMVGSLDDDSRLPSARVRAEQNRCFGIKGDS